MTTKLIAVAALVSLTFCGAATDARAAGSSATRSAPTILPSDIQGKWAWVYEENMSLQATTLRAKVSSKLRATALTDMSLV